MLKINLQNIPQVPSAGHTSKGDQPKWQTDGKWYKADNIGYEALAEVLISALLKKSNVTDYVEYRPVMIQYGGQELCGCVSDNFRGPDEILVPFERLHRTYTGSGLAQSIAHMETTEQIRYTVDFVEQITGLSGIGPYITMLLELDAFFLNEDRHTNNLAVLRNEKNRNYRLCPVFDNGLALLSDWNDYPVTEDIYQNISRVRAKPFALDFNRQAECANELYGSFLKFSFTKSDVTNILEGLSDFYTKDVLRRVTAVAFEQMRKYPIYF